MPNILPQKKGGNGGTRRRAAISLPCSTGPIEVAAGSVHGQ